MQKITEVNDEFQMKFESFMKGIENLELEHARKNGYQESLFSVDDGRRYIRVWREAHGQRSSHVFVDKTNGDILMCATWRAPAKHARGNLFNADNGLGCMGPYGAAYLR